MNEINKLYPPAFQHRFRIKFSGDENYIVAKQVQSCTINYTEKKVEVYLRQPLDNNEFEFALNAIEKSELTIEFLDSYGNSNTSSTWKNLCLISHTVELDYSNDLPVIHYLVFKEKSERTVKDMLALIKAKKSNPEA